MDIQMQGRFICFGRGQPATLYLAVFGRPPLGHNGHLGARTHKRELSDGKKGNGNGNGAGNIALWWVGIPFFVYYSSPFYLSG